MYIITLTCELDSTCFSSKVLGVFNSDAAAFRFMEKYDVLSMIQENMTVPMVQDGGIRKEMFTDEETGYAVYSETRYFVEKGCDRHSENKATATALMTITEITQ